MWFQSVLNSLKFGSARTRAERARRVAPRKRPDTTRLTLEVLEDRTLLSFLAPVSYAVGRGAQAVAVGDFNNDGIPDLVVANFDSANVSVLLGKGDGTFQPAQNFAVPVYPTGPISVAVGDFNGDGKLDIVTASYLSQAVSVLLGNGDGTFQPALNYFLPYQSGLPQNPLSFAVGDFNKDGKLDIAVTANTFTPGAPNLYGGYYPPTFYNGYVNVLIGNGAGSFSTDNVYPLSGVYPTAVAVGDFNGDSNLDLAVAEWDKNTVSVLLGNGNGTFGNPTEFATGHSLRSVAVGDFNGDHKLDLVTANYFSSNTVSVLLGNGNGTFGTAADYTTGIRPTSVAVGDFNRDGKLDIVTANGYDTSVSLLLGNGNGTFQTTQNFPAGAYPNSVAVGDFNRDGWPDLAVTNFAGTVSVLLNAADWSAIPPVIPLQASSFVVSGFPSTTTAGTAGTFTVTAKTASGTTATNYTGTVHFTSSDLQAFLPADYTFTAADQGVHSTFSATLKTGGTQSITAADRIAATGSQAGITVKPAAASHLEVNTGLYNPYGPPYVTAGTAFSVGVVALDPYNNWATGYTGTVHFTSSDPLAVLPGNYAFTAADAGQHAWGNGVILKTAGSQTVTATDTIAASVTGNAAVTVNPMAASTLAVAGFPSPATAGVAGAFTIIAKNADGTTATGYTGTVHFRSSDPLAVLPSNYTFVPADNGVHTFSATLKTAGAQSLTAKDTATVALSGSEGGITVNPAAASKFLITAPSSVTAGVQFSLTITVQDAYGNLVTGYTGTIHFTSTDTTATLPKNYTFTAADKGVHTFTGLVLRKKGTQKITITDTLDSSLTGSVIENVL